MSYRRRASPLHAARAASACAYCLALACAALMLENPLALGAVTLAIVAAGIGARVGYELRRAALLAVPLAIAITLINALATRDGLTVIARLGDLPVLGHTDITLEAIAYGAILGLRAIALILCGALYTAAVDPDQVLALFRRISFHSALSAVLATRMVPVLIRDSSRLADAQRCRPPGARSGRRRRWWAPGSPSSRVQLLRAASTNVLDRALDVAAALEVRGYGVARRPDRIRESCSRHDLAFGAAALGVLAIAIGARIARLAPFQAYPSLHAPGGPDVWICGAALLACALIPFANRRGVHR
ncbi:MAG: energy-coupling factor transporter transmembrane component T [Solirubrobacteraceae bacterium]